jgi:hypothetical protein
MPAKLSLICMIQSITERDSPIYIVREAIATTRMENNSMLNLKITFFVPKNPNIPRWFPFFETENILQLTGKFILDEQPPHDAILQVS